MTNLEKLNKNDLEELLKDLRLYKDLVQKIWNRWKAIFKNIFNKQNKYVVEYFWDLEKSYVLKESQKIYSQVFDLDVKDSEIELIQKQNLKWGLKIYVNDSLIDLSFLKFYNLLK